VGGNYKMQNNDSVLISDTKPKNYDYLTFTIISNIPNDGKVQMLRSLEKMMLKNIIQYPIRDNKISMDDVRIFEGKDRGKVLSIWYMEVTRKKKMAQMLMRVNKVKFN
jgi:hypothetical protein